MALSDRLYYSFRDLNGTYYKVAVKYNGLASIEVTGAGEGFTLNYTPPTNALFTGLIPSFADIYFIDNSDDVTDFLAEILEYQQEDYWLEITKSDDDITYTPYWRGVLLQDQIEEVEASKPRVVKLTALDGLSLLQTKDYDDANTILTEPARTKVNDIIRTSLQKGLTSDLWSASDEYLITCVNWWDSAQSYSATGDPLETLFLDSLVFQIFENAPNNQIAIAYKSAYFVLAEFCRAFGARLYMSEGAYYFEQVSERENSNVKRVKYDKTGTQLSAGLVNFDIPLNETPNYARRANNNYLYFPALKEVKASQKQYPLRSESDGNLQSWPRVEMALNTTNTRDWGVFDEQYNFNGTLVDNSLVFIVDINTIAGINVTGTNTINGTVQWWFEFDMRIELDDINSATNYYWNDSTQNWQTSSVVNTYKGPISSYQTITGTGTWYNTGSKQITIGTNLLPATGRVRVRLSDIAWKYRTQGSFTDQTIVTGTGTAVNFTSNSSALTITLDEVTEQGSTNRVHSGNVTNANIGDFETVDLGEIQFGDGSQSSGNLLPFNGVSIVRGGNWRRANDVTNISLGQLLVSERLRIQSDVLELYDAFLQMPFGFSKSISFDSKRYLPLNYEFLANSATVNARYFIINRDTSINPDLTTGDDFIRFPDFGQTSGKNKKGGELGDIIYSGDIFGYMRHNETDEEAQTIAPANMQKGQRNNYTTFDCSAAGSGSAADTDTVLFCTWTGGNGTYSIEIPDPTDMDGARIEIILDDTFDSNKTVEISAASGNVQGAASIELNGALTRQILRAIGENWW